MTRHAKPTDFQVATALTPQTDRCLTRHKRQRTAARAAAKGFPALEALAEAWIIRDLESDALMRAQAAAEQHTFAMMRKFGTLKVGRDGESPFDFDLPEPAPKALTAARRAEARAVRAYERRVDEDARLIATVLDVEPSTLDEALAKQALFAAMWGAKSVTDLPFNEDTRVALGALMHDIKAFSSVPPSTPPAQGTDRCATAAAQYLADVQAAVEVGSDPAAKSCPVAELIPALEEAMAREMSADALRDAEGVRNAETDRLWLRTKAERVQATSLVGAALQLAFAFEMAELIRGNTDQAVCDQHHTEFENHAKSALRLIGRELSETCWGFYIGGAHPTSATSRAAELIADYEALGGKFSVTHGPDGSDWLGTMWPTQQTDRSEEIEQIVNNDREVRHAVFAALLERDGRLPDPNAHVAELRPAMVA